MKYLNGKIYRIYKVDNNRTIYIGCTKRKYLSQVLQSWIHYYKTGEPLSYDIELLRSVPCISIDELNKARRTCRDEYAEAEPPPVEAPKVARLNTIPEHTTTRPRKVGLTPEDVRRLTASMFSLKFIL